MTLWQNFHSYKPSAPAKRYGFPQRNFTLGDGLVLPVVARSYLYEIVDEIMNGLLVGAIGGLSCGPEASWFGMSLGAEPERRGTS